MLINIKKCLKLSFCISIFILILTSISISVFAQTQPRLINFQGKLTDQQGQPLDGSYTIIFSLYAAPTGGTALWTERHENLSISQGLVNALLGSIQSLDSPQRVEFDAPRYLGITIDVDNNANSADPEMLPRQRIIPAIYANNADHAKMADIAETLVGGQNNYLVPQGGIIMWSGTLDTIPAGWALCDGTNGTPDLRDRFIMGAGNTNPGATGGASSYSLSVAQLPPHSHSGSTNTTGSHNHSASVSPNPHTHDVGFASFPVLAGGSELLVTRDPWASYTQYRYTVTTSTSLSVSVGNNGSHSHSVSTDNVGSGAFIDNRPAYYALAFIMKL